MLNFMDQVEFDAADPPGYAARAFDASQANPDTLRLTNWYTLERGDSAELDALVESHRDQIESIERAQAEGALPTHITPIELLTAVRALAMAWHTQTPEMYRIWHPDTARQRESIVENVRRLVALS